MINDLAFRSAAMLDDVWVMLKLTSGGFSDRDANDVAVNPTGPLGDARVMTATPAG